MNKNTITMDIGAMRAQGYKEDIYANQQTEPAADQASEAAAAIVDLMELLWDVEAGDVDD